MLQSASLCRERQRCAAACHESVQGNNPQGQSVARPVLGYSGEYVVDGTHLLCKSQGIPESADLWQGIGAACGGRGQRGGQQSAEHTRRNVRRSRGGVSGAYRSEVLYGLSRRRGKNAEIHSDYASGKIGEIQSGKPEPALLGR